jgi:Bardet-Biedl syndrome 7 protein
VTVADQDGVLQVFSLKKGDIQIGFKTLPGAGISCLELGGALGRYVFHCGSHFS